MNNFSVEFIPTSIELAKSGALVGKLHVDLDGTSFPDSEWSDFLVVIAQWMNSAFTLKSSTVKNAKFGFLDGPFEILLTKKPDGTITIMPHDRRGKSARSVSITNIDIDTIINELIRTAIAIITTCSNRGIEAADLSDINCMLRQIKK